MSMKRNPLSISLALLLASGPGLALAQTAEGAAPQSLSNAPAAARAPGTPTGVTAGTITPTSVELSWTASTGTVATYRVYTSSTVWVDTGSNVTTYTLTGLTPGRTYNVQVSALDAEDSESGKSTRVPVTTPSDTEAPTEPGSVEASDITATSAKLSWTAATDNTGVTGYDVLQNGIRLDTLAATATNYTFTGLAAETAYTLGVRARDAASNVSDIVSKVVTTLGGGPVDTTAPSVPTGLEFTGKTHNSISLKWDASIDETGGSGLKDYIVAKDGTDLSPVTATTQTVTGLDPETEYTFTVKARDVAGNVSVASTSIAVTTDASSSGTAPTAPTGLTAVGDPNTKDKVSLTWTSSTDADNDLAFYDVYSNGNLVRSVAAGTHIAIVEDLRQNATYEFVVRARDAAGNVSAECEDPTAACRAVRTRLLPRDTGDAGRVFAPHYPTHLRSNTLRSNSVKLEWDGAVSDVAANYVVYKDGVEVATVGTTEKAYTVSGLNPGTRYELTVASRNTVTNNLIAKAPPITVTTPAGACTAAPAAPTGITKATDNSASITLNWTAPTNPANCTELRYEVHRAGELVGEAPVAAFTDTALASSTSYSYTVKAINEFGDSSSTAVQLSSGAPGNDLAPRNVGYFEQWGVYGRQYFVKNILDSGAADVLTHIQYSFGNVQPTHDASDNVTGYVCETGLNVTTNEDMGTGGDALADYAHLYDNTGEQGILPTIGENDKRDGSQPLRGNLNQLRQLKAQKSHLKLLISLGGWTWTRNFSGAARPEHREAFVKSCIDTYIKGDLTVYEGKSWEGYDAGGPGAAAGLFDGIDIDWEYPVACGLHCDGRPEDRENFTALLAEFRKQLDVAETEVGRELSLSVAVGAGIDKIRATEVDKYHQYLDFISPMTYDFHGGWETTTNHHSPLFPSEDDPSTGDVAKYNVDDAIQEFLNHGVPASKLLVGIPYYGRGWEGVSTGTNNGLYQRASGPVRQDAEGASPLYVPWQAGITNYSVLATLVGQSGWTKHVDDKAKATWLFNSGYGESPGHFWTFDGPDEIKARVNYAKLRGLGGALIWALSGDTANGELSKALDEGWGSTGSK